MIIGHVTSGDDVLLPGALATSVRARMAWLWSRYVGALRTHPRLTNALTAGVVGAAGDALAQSIERGGAEPPEPARVARVAAWGLTAGGVPMYHWFRSAARRACVRWCGRPDATLCRCVQVAGQALAASAKERRAAPDQDNVQSGAFRAARRRADNWSACRCLRPCAVDGWGRDERRLPLLRDRVHVHRWRDRAGDARAGRRKDPGRPRRDNRAVMHVLGAGARGELQICARCISVRACCRCRCRVQTALGRAACCT